MLSMAVPPVFGLGVAGKLLMRARVHLCPVVFVPGSLHYEPAKSRRVEFYLDTEGIVVYIIRGADVNLLRYVILQPLKDEHRNVGEATWKVAHSGAIAVILFQPATF